LARHNFFHTNKKAIMEKLNDLRDLLKHEIEDLQSVEDQILEALPKMIDKANNPELKSALSEHLKATEQHKARLEKLMKTVQQGGEGSNGKKKGIMGMFGGGKQVCKGMKGIIEEGEKIMNMDISPEALDAAIIASAQKVEHYEICGYGTARTFARELGMEQVAKQLEQTLNEEYYADDLLTSLAVMGVNQEAETPGNNTSAAASSRGRSAGRVKEKVNREVEMEPVKSSRSGSTGRNERGDRTKSNNQSSNQPKASGSPRGENGRASGSSSKRTVNSGRSGSSKTANSSNGRSSSGGRGNASKSNSRGRR
jgi:ferritin-like metal-binding protein YciE